MPHREEHVFDPSLLDLIEQRRLDGWASEVWRQVFEGSDPLRGNLYGARWNPPNEEALYTACTEGGAVAEIDYLVSIQPYPIERARVLHRLSVSLSRVARLDHEDLELCSISTAVLGGDDHRPCQEVGAAAAWLGLGGLLVPSARSTSENLVVFVNRMDPDDELRLLT